MVDNLLIYRINVKQQSVLINNLIIYRSGLIGQDITFQAISKSIEKPFLGMLVVTMLVGTQTRQRSYIERKLLAVKFTQHKPSLLLHVLLSTNSNEY